MSRQQGKFIVIYGINNLGKTTQAKMLTQNLKEAGWPAEYLKYPIYDLKPSGPIINDYLRSGNPYNLSSREAQIFYTLNRIQFESELKKKLEAGINIIAEDYIGTGLAWGVSTGVEETFLRHINSQLLKEDLAFLFDGKRFRQAEEYNHQHETNEILINKVRKAHLKLAEEFGWIKINANQTREQIQSELWFYVNNFFNQNTNINSNFKKIYNNNSPNGNQNKELNQSTPVRELPVERLTSQAKLPTRAYKNDAGLDLYATEYCSLLPGQSAIVKTGIKMAIPPGFVGLILDKGGIAKAGIHIIAGVIDADFRGEIMVNLVNLGQDIYHIALGQKIAQLLIQPIALLSVKEMKIDDTTDRGSNGFGSSGLFSDK
jgi:dUTP pyrophosphatase